MATTAAATSSTSTTTVTSAEAEAAAEGTTTTITGSVTSTESDASSDAAAAIPGADFAVSGASTEPVATTPESTAEVTVTTTDPETGLPTTATTTTTGTVPGSTLSTGVAPTLTPDPVLPGNDDAILSRPFSADSPWNRTIENERLDPKSRQWMRLSRVRIARVQQANGEIRVERRKIKTGLTVNTTRWTLPVFSNTQEGAIERIAICRQFDCGPDALTSVVIPPDACPDPRYDGWMTVIDNTTNTAYDFWRARCEADGSISYHYVKAWALDGPGFQDPTGVSARGSGLPLFAGLITPEEIRDGRIDHALAISIPGAAQRRYVQPASRTDGTGLTESLPEGARIRLKKGAQKRLTDTFVRNKVERKTARTIINALRRYGAIVVDRSAAPTMYAQRNANWAGILPLNLLQEIDLGNFEAIKTGPLLFDPPKEGEETFTGTTEAPASIPGTTGGSSSGTIEFGTTDVTP